VEDLLVGLLGELLGFGGGHARGGGDCKRLGGKLKMAILIVKLYI